MRKILLLGSAFLLSTSAFALSVPAGRHLLGTEAADGVSGKQDGFVLASEHGEVSAVIATGSAMPRKTRTTTMTTKAAA